MFFNDSDGDSVIIDTDYKEEDLYCSIYSKNTSKDSSRDNSRNNSCDNNNYVSHIFEKIQKDKIKSLEKRVIKLKNKFVLFELKHNNDQKILKDILYKKNYDIVLKDLLIKKLKPESEYGKMLINSLVGSLPSKKCKKRKTENYSVEFLIKIYKIIQNYKKKKSFIVAEKLETYYTPFFKKLADERDKYLTDNFKNTIPFKNTEDGNLEYLI